MPECAPAICIDEKYEDRDNWPKKNRKWKVESEIKDKEKYIQEIEKRQMVKMLNIYSRAVDVGI